MGPRIKRAVDVEPTAPVWDDSPPPAVHDRLNAIRRDLARHPAEDWAGDYYAYWLEVLVSRSGAVAVTHGDMGTMGSNEGTVTQVSDGSLRIAWNLPNTSEWTQYPVRLLPVRWGERRYLLDPGHIDDFVAQINSGYEPRTLNGGSALFADGDAYRPVDGDVRLSGPYRQAIRARPLVARVLEVHAMPERTWSDSEQCRRAYRLHLSVAGGRPLRRDVFRATMPGVSADLDIDRVGDGDIEGVATVYEEPCRVPATTPDRSWVFQTHVFDPVEANRRIERQRKEDGVAQAKDT